MKKPTRSTTRKPAARKPVARVATQGFNNWVPRDYQQDVVDRFPSVRYHYHIWHRRAGKDALALNLTSREIPKRIGSYWHLFPLHVQARRAIWKGIDKNGQRFIDQVFPEKTRRKVYDQDMLIEFECGSTWQLAGSDYYDRLVGANPVGVVFSEWALCDPRAWGYVRPILRENGGYAFFITTYRGRNHAFQMFRQLRENPQWYCTLKTVTDTNVLTEADIQEERDAGMSEAMIQQEFYCNPLAAAEGAIYGASMEYQLTNNAGNFPYDPRKPVTAAWSLKFHPVNVSVVFGQGENIIGSRSYMFEDLPTALTDIESSLPWRVATHVVSSEDTESGQFELFADAGIYPRVSGETREIVIKNAASTFLKRSHFDTVPRRFEKDAENNMLLVEALNGYTAKEVGVDAWTLGGVTSHSYLARAFEIYAAWHNNNSAESWSRPPSNQLNDRFII